MADKVLKLFWTLAHSSDASTDIMDQALAAHVKILDYSCTQYREQQKNRWLDKCVEELKSNDKWVPFNEINSNGDNMNDIARWVLPALKQIKEICSLYQEQPARGVHGGQRTAAVVYRSEVINRLQQREQRRLPRTPSVRGKAAGNIIGAVPNDSIVNSFQGPNIETEQCLPGVLMAHTHNHASFLCQLGSASTASSCAPPAGSRSGCCPPTWRRSPGSRPPPLRPPPTRSLLLSSWSSCS